MANSIRVKANEMRKLSELYKLNASGMAERIGVNRETYLRAMEGGNVSASFVAGATLGFGIEFSSLFYSVRAENVAA
ncbi:hypothetical protein ACLI1L_000161 [Corynebacterium sp. LaCa117]|uniref:hypothetical protein n=1 Tax=Corynebacterium sp. LaCa117 TaxID=3391424 RepID=UPI00398A2FB4